MSTKQNRTQIAESAIFLLSDGITSANRSKIIEAYDRIENDDSFNWDDLDTLYSEWEELVDKANDVLHSLKRESPNEIQEDHYTDFLKDLSRK